jgi:hypothetical protein
MQEGEAREEHSKCFFYFKYQMKLEFIPYVEQEIQEFLDLGEAKVQQPARRPRILVALKRRIQQIDAFFQKYWSDYRIQQGSGAASSSPTSSRSTTSCSQSPKMAPPGTRAGRKRLESSKKRTGAFPGTATKEDQLCPTARRRLASIPEQVRL